MWAGGAASAVTNGELQTLIDDMRVQDFDSIRFATYRAACKLRFVQKKTNVHLVDIWNMIESFRENGFNAMQVHSQVKTSRLELLLTTVFHNLNKRLVASQHIDTDHCISLLLAFLLGTYDKQQTGRLSVFSIKIAMATLCAGKLVDKLRYIFSQISDSSGFLDHDRFTDFMQQVLALTTSVFEAPTFGFSESAVQQCFQKDQRVTLNIFLDVFLSDPCPPCLMWLPLLHRMAAVENVYHPVVCDACQVRTFTGFRYKCQRCSNYQLCQNCFWRGRTSQNHSNEHEMKEYSTYAKINPLGQEVRAYGLWCAGAGPPAPAHTHTVQDLLHPHEAPAPAHLFYSYGFWLTSNQNSYQKKSPTKQFAHSIHKSLQCIPTVSPRSAPLFNERPQRPLELQNIVPATPTTIRRQGGEGTAGWPSSPLLLPGQVAFGGMMDDEHKLIARYAAKLSGRSDYPLGTMTNGREQSRPVDERMLISQLEEENALMVREMQRLENQVLCGDDDQLCGLRDRKSQLEEKMFIMQQKRRDLMMQLEQLMTQLNIQTPQTTTELPSASLGHIPESLSGVGTKVSNAFRGGSLPITTANLQGDLLHAAEQITTNVSDLVRELDQAQESGIVANGHYREPY